jgi:hypothetical protein
MKSNSPNMINNLPAVVKNIQVKICLLRLYLLKLEFVGVGVDFYRVAKANFFPALMPNRKTTPFYSI